jgi:hypothetical protein
VARRKMLICGMECGKGGSLKKHVEMGHNVNYDLGYKRCFKGGDVVFSKVASDLSGEIVVQTRVLKVPPKQK